MIVENTAFDESFSFLFCRMSIAISGLIIGGSYGGGAWDGFNFFVAFDLVSVVFYLFGSCDSSSSNS